MNSNGYVNGEEKAALIAPQVARVRGLEAEFRQCQKIHIDAGKITQNPALRWWHKCAAEIWDLAAEAVAQALHPSFAGAPPAEWAATIKQTIQLSERAAFEAFKRAQQGAPSIMDAALDAENQHNDPVLGRGPLPDEIVDKPDAKE